MRTTPRRGFLKSLAVAPLLPAAVQVPQATPEPPAATPSPSPSPSASPGPTPLALALAEAVRQRFGAELNAEDLAEVATGIDGNLQAASRLRERLRQGNADEPVTLFEARPTPYVPPPAPVPARSRRRRTRR